MHGMATEITTERLILRDPEPSDAPALAARRSDPDVARYQSWNVPFPIEEAESMVTHAPGLSGLVVDEWSMVTVAERDADKTVVGDIAVLLTWDGRVADIGYTFASEHWGKGYAAEAVAAMVRWLFEERAVERVAAGLNPDNVASAMVLERTGFEFEGRKIQAYWTDDGAVSDDAFYGVTRTMWEDWLGRPTGPATDVRLVEIDATNYRAVRALRTHKSQERLVSPVINSFADAQFPEPENGHPVVPWMRAVEADGEFVGFVMVAVTTEHHEEPYLWRLLVDRRHQRRGIGRRVLDLVVDECRARGDRTLMVSWVDGKGSPRPLYERYGFVPTGEIEHGEVVARLVID